jgi:ATP-dependent Clp protease adaptor protein ClpS
MVKEKLHPVWEEQADTSSGKELIDTLMEVCGHDAIQAEQCAIIAHYNGKCPVKSGTYQELKPVCDEMTSRELTVSIS